MKTKSVKTRSLWLLAFAICCAFTLAQAQDVREVSHTLDYVAKFTGKGAGTENSLIYDNGSNVGVSTTTPVALFDVNGSLNASSYTLDEQPFAIGSFSNQNGFFGFSGNSSLTGIENTAVGAQALSAVTTGNWNEAIGFQALLADTTGHSNAAVGLYSMPANTSGNYNAALGNRSLQESTTGQYNVGVGYYGGQTLDGSGLTGGGNTGIGAGSAFSTGSLSNATALGNNAVVSESNAVVLGCIEGVNNCATTTNIGIAMSAPNHILAIGQGFGEAFADGWMAWSSRRFKTNIQPLHGALEKVEQLRGVSYDLKGSGKHQIGVIAEEVGAVVPEVVSWEKNGKDAAGVDYARLTALLIEATKEQQALIEKQAQQLQLQQTKIEDLTRQVSVIQTALHQNGELGSTVLTASVAVH